MPRGKTAVLTSDQELEIVRCYEFEPGTSYSVLTSRWGISHQRLKKILEDHGVTIRPRYEAIRKLARETHSGWNGGVVKRANSKSDRVERFIMVDEGDFYASMRDRQGYAREHRLVVAKHLGRPLTRQETVHHIDGDTLNNDILNLQLRSKNHGPGQIRSCGDCGSQNIICEPLPEEFE